MDEQCVLLSIHFVADEFAPMCPLYKLFGLILAPVASGLALWIGALTPHTFLYTTSSSRPPLILYMSPNTVDILCPSVVEPVLDNFVSD